VGTLFRGARCMMIMMIISPFGQLGLWAPSSEVRILFKCVSTNVRLNQVCTPQYGTLT
jgi:hypothetical protein